MELLNKLVLIDDFLSNIKNEPFFYFCKNVKFVFVSFNNPQFHSILKDVKMYRD